MQNKITTYIDYAGKYCAITAAFFIPLSVSITSFACLFAAVGTLLSGHYKSKIKALKNNQVAIIALIFVVFVAVSMLYSQADTHSSLIGLRKYGRLAFIPLLIPLFSNKYWRDLAIHAFLLSMIFATIIIFTKYFGWTPHIGNTGDPASLFINHIDMGFLTALTAFICIHKSFLSKKFRLVYFVVFLLASYATIYINVSRTGYLVYLALVALFLLQKMRGKGILASILIVPALAVSLFLSSPTFKTNVSMAIDNTRNYSHNSDTSVGDRITFAKNSLQLIKKKPVFGYGPGSFDKKYRSTFKGIPGFMQGPHTPHDEYLLILMQFGIIGLALFLIMLLTQLISSFSLPEDLRYISQGVLLAFAAASAFNSYLFQSTPGHFYVILMAICFSGLMKKATI